MIQFINCTEEVSYDKEKAHSDLLMMINATVSHELRNPLNSLLAQNIQKKEIYKYLINLILKSKLDEETKK